MLRNSEIDMRDKIKPLLPDHYHILNLKHKLHNLSLKLLYNSVTHNFYLRLYLSSMFINTTTFQLLVLFPSSGDRRWDKTYSVRPIGRATPISQNRKIFWRTHAKSIILKMWDCPLETDTCSLFIWFSPLLFSDTWLFV